MYKAIFYDLDNTLYDQTEDIKQRIYFCTNKYNLNNKIAAYWLKEWLDGGPLKNNLIDNLVIKYNLDLNKNELIDSFKTYKTELILDVNIKRMLLNFKSNGIYQFIVTNGNQNMQEHKIRTLGLDKIVNEYKCAIPPYTKPSPYWYDYLMKKYGLSHDDCISVGDWYASEGMAAKNLNIKFLYLQNKIFKEKVLGKEIKKIKSIYDLIGEVN